MYLKASNRTSTHRLDADGVLLLSKALHVNHRVAGAVQVLGLQLSGFDYVHLHLVGSKGVKNEQILRYKQ